MCDDIAGVVSARLYVDAGSYSRTVERWRMAWRGRGGVGVGGGAAYREGAAVVGEETCRTGDKGRGGGGGENGAWWTVGGGFGGIGDSRRRYRV